MRKKRYFQKLYNYEQETNTYLIDVSLDDYDDIYDDWDPSPFKKRDIENEFNEFIVDSSDDIPFNFGISIVLYLPESKKDTQKEAALISAYNNFYQYTMERTRKQILSIHKKTLSYLLLAVLMLSLGYFFEWNSDIVMMQVIHEGIFIGGWVFLWEFFTNIFILTRDLKNEFKLYKRLYEADTRFIYK